MSWEVIIYKQNDTYGKDTFNVLDLYDKLQSAVQAFCEWD